MTSWIAEHWRGIQRDPVRGFQMFAVVRQATALLISVIVVKNLDLDEVGVFEVWMFVGMVLALLWLNGAFQSFVTLFPSMKPVDQSRFIGTTYLNIALVTAALAATFLLFKEFLTDRILQMGTIPFLDWALLYLFLHLTASYSSYILLVKKRHQAFLPYSLVYLCAQITAVVVPFVFGGGLREVIYGLVFFAILEQLYLIYLVTRYGTWSISGRQWSQLSRLAVPLGLYAILGSFPQVFDAWLINWWYNDLEVFAVFRYGARELPGSLAMASSFGTAMIVILASDVEDGMNRLRTGVTRLMHLFFPLSSLLILLSPLLFKWIYSEDFILSAFVFNTYLLLMLSRWLFPHTLILAKKDSRILVLVSSLEMLLNISLSIFLIGYWGIMGVAAATVIAYIFEKLALVVITKVRYGLGLFDFVPPGLYFKYCIVLISAFIISVLLFNIPSV